MIVKYRLLYSINFETLNTLRQILKSENKILKYHPQLAVNKFDSKQIPDSGKRKGGHLLLFTIGILSIFPTLSWLSGWRFRSHIRMQLISKR